MKTQPNRPPPFLRRHQLEQGQPDLHSRLAGRRRTRRVAAMAAVIAGLALAVGVSLYLATPREPRQWRAPRSQPKTSALQATPLPAEPGAVGLQVQRGKKRHVFRLRQEGESWTIEEVTSAGRQRKRQTRAEPLRPWSSPASEKPSALTP